MTHRCILLTVRFQVNSDVHKDNGSISQGSQFLLAAVYKVGLKEHLQEGICLGEYSACIEFYCHFV